MNKNIRNWSYKWIFEHVRRLCQVGSMYWYRFILKWYSWWELDSEGNAWGRTWVERRVYTSWSYNWIRYGVRRECQWGNKSNIWANIQQFFLEITYFGIYSSKFGTHLCGKMWWRYFSMDYIVPFWIEFLHIEDTWFSSCKIIRCSFRTSFPRTAR